jgi:hypothetical protein
VQALATVDGNRTIRLIETIQAMRMARCMSLMNEGDHVGDSERGTVGERAMAGEQRP